jgi:hypothetical protein
MSDDLQPTNPSSKSSARRSARFTELLNDSPPRRKPTPLGVDTAWALKLKEAINTTARDLHVQVLSAKPICTDEVSDSGSMRFELETDRGVVIATRHRDGSYEFDWQ